MIPTIALQITSVVCKAIYLLLGENSDLDYCNCCPYYNRLGHVETENFEMW